MYHEIIALHRKRILERLRSRHSKSLKARGKRSLLSRLRDAESILRSSKLVPAHTLSEMKQSLGEIQGHSDRLEAIPSDALYTTSTLQCFVVLVECLNHFADQHMAKLYCIDIIPGLWEADAMQGVRSRLDKLTEYKRACKGLLRALRRFQCFKTFSIHFLRDRNKHTRGEEATTLSRIGDQSLQDVVGRMSLLNGQLLSTTRSRLQSSLRREIRLHAETQIMVYLDMTMSSRKPRFIVSGKRACFLCHLMLSLHDHFYALNSHGRLNDTWCVPPMVESTRAQKSTAYQQQAHDLQVDLRKAFAGALDCKIEELLAQESKVRGKYPMESTVKVLRSITPTVFSRTSNQVSRVSRPQSLAPLRRPGSGNLLTSTSVTTSLGREENDDDTMNVKSTKLMGDRNFSKRTHGYLVIGSLKLFLEYETTSSLIVQQIQPVGTYEIHVEAQRNFPAKSPRIRCLR
ncbi:hypothetical protein KVT40_002295 [Elsinoe batatas]|uniref:Uncharacterized protein n=1 Tax=Elsinoe batatas TaxID=2601811 RepID=A0A8K0PI24_9PEZI|nr:hypothetical protein KVT40_002295 [Elsinoe batatas]